jgi:hypothetical protein
MGETPETPTDPKARLTKEFEDPHYHDEEEAVPAEDGPAHPHRLPGRKPPRRPQTRRRFYEE